MDFNGGDLARLIQAEELKHSIKVLSQVVFVHGYGTIPASKVVLIDHHRNPYGYDDHVANKLADVLLLELHLDLENVPHNDGVDKAADKAFNKVLQEVVNNSKCIFAFLKKQSGADVYTLANTKEIKTYLWKRLHLLRGVNTSESNKNGSSSSTLETTRSNSSNSLLKLMKGNKMVSPTKKKKLLGGIFFKNNERHPQQDEKTNKEQLQKEEETSNSPEDVDVEQKEQPLPSPKRTSSMHSSKKEAKQGDDTSKKHDKSEKKEKKKEKRDKKKKDKKDKMKKMEKEEGQHHHHHRSNPTSPPPTSTIDENDIQHENTSSSSNSKQQKQKQSRNLFSIRTINRAVTEPLPPNPETTTKEVGEEEVPKEIETTTSITPPPKPPTPTNENTNNTSLRLSHRSDNMMQKLKFENQRIKTKKTGMIPTTTPTANKTQAKKASQQEQQKEIALPSLLLLSPPLTPSTAASTLNDSCSSLFSPLSPPSAPVPASTTNYKNNTIYKDINWTTLTPTPTTTMRSPANVVIDEIALDSDDANNSTTTDGNATSNTANISLADRLSLIEDQVGLTSKAEDYSLLKRLNRLEGTILGEQEEEEMPNMPGKRVLLKTRIAILERHIF